MWRRLLDEQPLARAAAQVSWAVGRTLSYAAGTKADADIKPSAVHAVKSWARKTVQTLDEVRRELDRLVEEVADRG
jgi:hypothetical protein